MVPALVVVLGLTPTFDPTSPKRYPPVYVPAEAAHGYLYQPAFDLHPVPRGTSVRYEAKPGDVLLLSDTNPFWTTLFRLAITGKPGHNALVVTMPDGRLGAFESGYGDALYSRVTPLDYRLNVFPGYVWIRARETPLTPEQDRRLTEFAVAADGKRYALFRFLSHGTPLSARGPIRTAFFGKPIGIGQRYFCSQATLEALIYTGLIDGRTSRPAATFPQDMFFDRSRNRYIDQHPPLANGWSPPQLWTPIVGTALRGKTRPQPPFAWPGPDGAYLVQPVATPTTLPGPRVPTPVVVGYVGGENRPLPVVESISQRLGLLDSPGRPLR